MPPPKKLGRMRDDKKFIYHYAGKDDFNGTYSTQQRSSVNVLQTQSMNGNQFFSDNQSLVNASKLPYNLISNTIQPEYSLNRNVFLFSYFSGLIQKESFLFPNFLIKIVHLHRTIHKDLAKNYHRQKINIQEREISVVTSVRFNALMELISFLENINDKNQCQFMIN